VSMPAPDDRTAVLLLHGFWHGSWCWTEVLARLTAAGVRALAVDMAGHGLRASRPAALTRRPFAAEVSPPRSRRSPTSTSTRPATCSSRR